MFTYSIQRLAIAVPVLLLLAALTFFLLRLAPGGPFDGDVVWPPEVQANILKKYELDQPVHIQFTHWLGDVVRGDLRESFQYLGRPVREIISDALPASLFLGSMALLLACASGITLGAVAAWKQNTWIDHTAMFVAISGISLPTYLVATVLILIFSLWLDWFPPALWDEPGSAVLPIITLAWRPLAMIARLTRTMMIETFSADYVRTAYSKGMSESAVVFKHVLKNSLIPVITLLGPITASLVTGSFLVEIVFQVPGIGKHFVQAVINRDYPLVMGVTLVYGVVLILCNLAVDLIYAWVDPRIRLKG
ncbi:MAG: peptide ABC transporter permease [Bdellovibrionales bacterium GWC1_52_8]|nr:MAG: peptide ABC transporter permease [Bdellovibrionales bacterium GWA1_52_35]OFZ42320.1 MAG: peptide ABC transporter permease [Bdellovibrionales bacterium GWC1_52_8]